MNNSRGMYCTVKQHPSHPLPIPCKTADMPCKTLNVALTGSANPAAMHGALIRTHVEHPGIQSPDPCSLFRVQPSGNSPAASYEDVCIYQQSATIKQDFKSRGCILMLALVFASSSMTNTNRPAPSSSGTRKAGPKPSGSDLIHQDQYSAAL
jgi:hypothetical protein